MIWTSVYIQQFYYYVKLVIITFVIAPAHYYAKENEESQVQIINLNLLNTKW